MALAMTTSRASTWARAAISGTTPPNAACSVTCDSTTLERILPWPSSKRSTNAAAVSSHVVSMPRTIISPSIAFAPSLGEVTAAKIIASPDPWADPVRPSIVRLYDAIHSLLAPRNARQSARAGAGANGAVAVGRCDGHEGGSNCARRHSNFRRYHSGSTTGGRGWQRSVYKRDRGGVSRWRHRSRSPFGTRHAHGATGRIDTGGMSRT